MVPFASTLQLKDREAALESIRSAHVSLIGVPSQQRKTSAPFSAFRHVEGSALHCVDAHQADVEKPLDIPQGLALPLPKGGISVLESRPVAPRNLYPTSICHVAGLR